MMVSGNGSFVYPRGICFDHFEHWTDPIFLYISYSAVRLNHRHFFGGAMGTVLAQGRKAWPDVETRQDREPSPMSAAGSGCEAPM